MTPAEFRGLLRASSDAEIVRLCLDDEAQPFVFGDSQKAWQSFRGETADLLGVQSENIRVVGSGRFGFSLKPANNLRAFQDTSDVDVVVVNAELFDRLWLNVLSAAYPRPPNLQTAAQLERQKEVYTGWISPENLRFDNRLDGARVRPVLDFRTQWFNAFKRVSRHIVQRHEDVSARLYRTWGHVELYHLDSVRSLRRALDH
jgi:hypothetical protein